MSSSCGLEFACVQVSGGLLVRWSCDSKWFSSCQSGKHRYLLSLHTGWFLWWAQGESAPSDVLPRLTETRNPRRMNTGTGTVTIKILEYFARIPTLSHTSPTAIKARFLNAAGTCEVVRGRISYLYWSWILAGERYGSMACVLWCLGRQYPPISQLEIQKTFCRVSPRKFSFFTNPPPPNRKREFTRLGGVERFGFHTPNNNLHLIGVKLGFCFNESSRSTGLVRT